MHTHFKSTDTNTTSNNWDFGLDKVTISNGRFDYNDEHVEPVLTGVDYSHVDIKKLNLKASGVQFIPSGIITDSSFLNDSISFDCLSK